MLKVARQHDSIVIEADARHLLTDVWTSAGVIGGLLVVDGDSGIGRSSIR